MEVQDLVRRVSRHFFDLVDEDSNPLVVALALQDNSSVGLQHYASEFKELRGELRKSLKARVDESYQGFNESVGVYRQVGSALKSSHEGISEITTKLNEMQDMMGHKKLVLGDLHQKSIRLKTKIDILSDLEQLYEFPVKFEALLAKKQFIDAATLLGVTMEIINFRNFLRQPNLKSLLLYVRRQRSQLVELIIDETKRVIYSSLSSSTTLLNTSGSARGYTQKTQFEIFLGEVEKVFNDDTLLGTSLTPNGNYFVYLAQLVKLLAGLQTLEPFLDDLNSSLDADLTDIKRSNVSKVINELKITPSTLRRASKEPKTGDSEPLVLLAECLYEHYTRVLECHKALSMICSKLNVSYTLDLVSKALIEESNEFMLQYLGKDMGSQGGNGGGISGASGASGAGTSSGATATSSNGTGTAESSFSVMFEFGPEDEDSQGLHDFQVLHDAIKQKIPGLLPNDPNTMYADINEHESLEVVCPVSILNIRAILEPALEFFNEATILTRNTLFESVIETFMISKFLPRLEKKFDLNILNIMQTEGCLNVYNSFNSVSKLPVSWAVFKFAEMIQIYIHLTDLQHQIRCEYVSVLIRVLHKISNFLCSKLGNLFFVPTLRNYIFVWNLSIEKNYTYLMQKRIEDHPDTKREFEVYFSKRRTPFSSKTLITFSDLLDINLYKDISLSLTSLKWLVHWLKTIKSDQTSLEMSSLSLNSLGNSAKIKQKWALIDDNVKSQSLFAVSLLLDSKNVDAFDSIVINLEKHAIRALIALRADLFFRIVYYFDQMIANREFVGKGPGETRDPIVERLQQELSLISQVLSAHLVSEHKLFVFEDVPKFMNELFILEGENINDMDEFGQSQILTNIFAFQQMSTSLVDDPREVDFSRATWFYELFRLTPSLIIDRASLNEANLGKDDLIKLLEIRHRNAANSGSAQPHSFGSLAFHVNQLNEIFDNPRVQKRQSFDSNITGSVFNTPSHSKNNSTSTTAVQYVDPVGNPVGNSVGNSVGNPSGPSVSHRSSKSSLNFNYTDSKHQEDEDQIIPKTKSGRMNSDSSVRTQETFYSLPRSPNLTHTRYDSKSGMHTILQQGVIDQNQNQNQNQNQ